MMTTEEIVAAFEELKADDPQTFYNACGYGNDADFLMQDFVSGSFEMGLIVGAKYALEHWAAPDAEAIIGEIERRQATAFQGVLAWDTFADRFEFDLYSKLLLYAKSIRQQGQGAV